MLYEVITVTDQSITKPLGGLRLPQATTVRSGANQMVVDLLDRVLDRHAYHAGPDPRRRFDDLRQTPSGKEGTYPRHESRRYRPLERRRSANRCA